MSEPQHDPDTGEIIEFEQRAADGGIRYPSVTSLTDLVMMLADGQFNADSREELQRCAETMEEMGCDTGAKVKGKITLNIEVERTADGIYFFTPDLAVKLPKRKEKRTIGWVTEDNRWTPNKPNQGQLFGTMRDISTGRTIRN